MGRFSLHAKSAFPTSLWIMPEVATHGAVAEAHKQFNLKICKEFPCALIRRMVRVHYIRRITPHTQAKVANQNPTQPSCAANPSYSIHLTDL
jgi:hypothetical protein